MVDLTSTERALLRAAKCLIDEDPQGRRPPFRQIAMRVGLSPSTVYGHFKAMKAKGAVTWQPRRPCTLEILIDLDTLPLSSASLTHTSTSDRRRLGGRQPRAPHWLRPMFNLRPDLRLARRTRSSMPKHVTAAPSRLARGW